MAGGAIPRWIECLVIIRIDPSGPPPYVQISHQLTAMIHAGAVPAGTRLPAIRHLDNDLGVAVNTVGRAYQELEAAGLVSAAGRRGTVVESAVQAEQADGAALAGSAERLALEARHRGLSVEAAIDQLRAAFGRLDLEGS